MTDEIDERGKEIRREWLLAKWHREADLIREWEVRSLGSGVLRPPAVAELRSVAVGETVPTAFVLSIAAEMEAARTKLEAPTFWTHDEARGKWNEALTFWTPRK